MLRHRLAPLLAPRGIALVGASARAGSLGRIVWENLTAAGPKGGLQAVNPKHRSVLGERRNARLADPPGAPELAVPVTLARTVPALVAKAGRVGDVVSVVRALQPAAMPAIARTDCSAHRLPVS